MDSRGAASSSLRLDAGGPAPQWACAASASASGWVWLEGRPEEGGRGVLCTHAEGDLTPPGVDVRSRVHEYGGGAWCVVGGCSSVVFSTAEGGVWRKRCERGAEVEAVVGAGGGRFADFGEDGGGRARVVCVRETEGEAAHAVVAVELGSGAGEGEGEGEVEVVASGADFYASPVVSRDGAWVAWVEWDHPRMPWDGTTLRVAALDPRGRVVGESRVVAGGEGESVGQPRWAPRGTGGVAVLGFCSDRDGGWSNLWFVEVSSDAAGAPRRMHGAPVASEYAGAAPGWRLGESTWAWAVAPGRRLRAVAVRHGPAEGGAAALSAIDPYADVGDPAKEVDIWVPFDGIACLAVASDGADDDAGEGGLLRVAVVGSSARRPTAVAEATAKWGDGGGLVFSDANPSAAGDGDGDGDGGEEGDGDCQGDGLRGSPWAVRRWASPPQAVPRAYVSVPELVEFPTEGGRTAWMWLYLPRSATHRGGAGERPPVLVRAHGGPTACASSALDLRTQYWTSRGYAVADVDYGGSSGYGRAYRERLLGLWGEVDVADCCAAAGFLATRGLVDSERMAIAGGSAGGFTALACLAFRPGVFACGASHYGIGDLSLLAKHTHKFEARYLDSLVGPLDDALYMQRSPISKADRIRAPVIFFQGELDAVVPREQAEAMHAAVAAQSIATELVVFPGERHGFLRADHIAACLDRQHAFFAAVFGHPIHTAPDETAAAAAAATATAAAAAPEAPPRAPKKDD